jgi:hypothetical protein
MIVVEYTSAQPFGALPVDYWLLLSLEALGWSIVIVSLQIFLRLDGIPVRRIPFLQSLRNQTGWIICALACALMAVSGILSDHFLGVTPAVVIANIAITGFPTPSLSQQAKHAIPKLRLWIR